MANAAQNPLSLIKGVVSARSRADIEYPGYTDALNVLARHFAVYEQRLQVMTFPASFPDGEVMLEAAGQGLEKLRSAVDGLSKLDPLSAPERANEFIGEAEQGFGLLAQLQEVTQEKKQEFEEAYREYEEDPESTGQYTDY